MARRKFPHPARADRDGIAAGIAGRPPLNDEPALLDETPAP